MNNDEMPEVGGITAVFPFVMVLSAMFATGLVFTVVNVPLLLQLLNGTRDSSFVHVATATTDFWSRSVPNSPGVGEVLFYLLALLIVGFAVQPVAGMYVTLIGKVVERLLNGQSKAPRFYLPPVVRNPEYLTFAAWIHRHRVERNHWEWELFNQYLYVGIAFNVPCGTSLGWLVSGRGLLSALVLGILVVLSTLYALARCEVMQRVYEFYSKRAGKGEPILEAATTTKEASDA